MECKRLSTHSLKLWRERGNDCQVARTLRSLSDANRRMNLNEEGIPQAKEASEIFEQLGEVDEQAHSLIILAWLLCQDGRLEAAEETGSRAINLLPEKGEEFLACLGYRVLGYIYRSGGKMKQAVHHFKTALRIASSLDVANQLFWVNYSLAEVFSEQDRVEDAQTHLDHAKSHALNNTYNLARAMDLQAWIWDQQGKFGDAKSEALHAIDAFEKLGAVDDAEVTRQFLRNIEAQRRI